MDKRKAIVEELVKKMKELLSVEQNANIEALVRSGDVESLGMMDCPVWCIQEEITGYDDNDNIFKYWETTEGIWFTAEEAKDWGDNHEYRLGHPWRVYGVAARGRLKALLKAHTDY